MNQGTDTMAASKYFELEVHNVHEMNVSHMLTITIIGLHKIGVFASTVITVISTDAKNGDQIKDKIKALTSVWESILIRSIDKSLIIRL